jgi:hypothetical protein
MEASMSGQGRVEARREMVGLRGLWREGPLLEAWGATGVISMGAEASSCGAANERRHAETVCVRETSLCNIIRTVGAMLKLD